jgi:DNA-directed RNA polymerase subunit omega
VDKLLTKVNSKYRLVHAISKRAHMISEGDAPLLDDYKSAKEIGIALEEIYNDLVKLKQ